MRETRIAVIPAYDPDAELVHVAQSLACEGFEVVVVDDGSCTEARAVFNRVRHCATLLAHEDNRGKGAAIKTGLRHVLSTYGEDCIVATVDADGQHDTADVVRVCDDARRHPESLVLGSRAFEGDVPARSKLGNGATRIVFRLVSGVSVRDTQTGLRAFSGSLAARMLEIGGMRYEYEMNVLMEFARASVPLREVDVSTIYINGNAASHFNPVKDSVRIYREILKFSASSFASFIIDYALFCAILALTGSSIGANVGARMVSAAANYSLNRTMVFGNSAPVAQSLARYVALATFMLACNTVALGALVALGAHPLAAKVCVEIALFAISYFAQRLFVFGKEKTDYETAYLGNRV